jgi:Uma2 family endonuclease
MLSMPLWGVIPMAIDILSLDLPQITVPDSARTLEGFRDWMASDDCPERGRFAFLENKLVVDMSPENLESHNKVKQVISLTLGNLVHELDLGTFYPDGALITNTEIGISNEPDAIVVLWESFENGRVQTDRSIAKPCELVGSPDLVIEVISPSSVRKDTRILRRAYFDAGIREYWLVDARGEEIDFQILIRGNDGFVAVEPCEGMTDSEVLPASFRLTRERDRVGLWKYTLHVARR